MGRGAFGCGPRVIVGGLSVLAAPCLEAERLRAEAFERSRWRCLGKSDTVVLYICIAIYKYQIQCVTVFSSAFILVSETSDGRWSPGP